MNDGMLGGVGNECIPKPPLPPFRMGKWLGRIPLVFLAVFLLRHAAKRLSKHVPFVTDAVYATCPDKVKPTAKMARMQAKHPLCSLRYQRNTLPDATGSLIRASNRQDGYSIVRTNPRASEGQDSGYPRGMRLFHKSVALCR